MKIALLLMILVIYSSTIEVTDLTAYCDHHTYMIGLNSTSFLCPNVTENCHNVSVNYFNGRHEHLRTNCYNKLVFESGIHYLKGNLSLRAGYHLIVVGQGNTTITGQQACLVNISLSADLNVTIKGLRFYSCIKIKVFSSVIQITNTFLNKSYLTLKKANGKSAQHLLVQGSESTTDLNCDNAAINISVASQTIVRLRFKNCSYVNLISRLKSTAIQIHKAQFTNSCLRFIAIRTKSPTQHVVSITVKKTMFKHCTCHSMKLLAIPSIHFFNITLNNVSATENHSPFLESENIAVSIMITGICVFHRSRNLVLNVDNATISFIKAKVCFIHGTVTGNVVQGAPIYAKNSIFIFEESNILFRQNQGPLCGGIATESTQIYFKDNVTVTFRNNSGLNGGALSLYTGSRLHFNATDSNITLYFENNTAQLGGAIYVEDSGYRGVKSVFKLECEPENVTLMFDENNVASFSGNQIYGGWIDWFVNETNNIPENRTDIVNTFVKFSNESYTQVSSHPIRICLCINNSVNCSITKYNKTIYGKALSLDLVAVGQRFTPVITHVQMLKVKSKTDQSNNRDARLLSLQSSCTKIDYRIDSKFKEEMLTLKPYLPYLYYSSHARDVITNDIDDGLFQQLTVKLKIKQCPWGFIEQINGSCECQLLNQSLQCDMNDYTILRSEQQWVGVTYEYNYGNKNPGVIAHQHCPFDYCRTDNKSLSICLENQDEQCAFNREGILCGGCKENLSRVMGTSNCTECTNKYTLLIVVSWLISGLILVMCLMLLNLTVSVGTINGLTFYANIVRAQHTTFFTPEDKFLSKFIAWLNLDLGTEMCLYDGLDSYSITWLQYAYPLYIWLIAAVVIILSHNSSRISKLCGKNAVQVLATLFLISYSRLLRLMIEVFSFTWITYPDGYKKAVWLVDGNYEFFKGRLIPLVLVTIIFVLLTLPYTLTLLTIQFLHKMSHHRIFFWVHRLKPLFDAYTGPYKSPHRYWTGLLLVARIALLITFSVNQSNNLSINLLAIVTVSVVLLGWLSFANWVYDSPLNNFLEIIFLVNLGLTAAVVSFDMSNGKNSPAAIYLSTSVAFALLIFIILYHIYRRLVLTKLGSKLTVMLTKLGSNLTVKVTRVLDDSDNTVELSDINMSTPGHSDVTSTIVDPYSHVNDSYNSHDLKEPLLEDNN